MYFTANKPCGYNCSFVSDVLAAGFRQENSRWEFLYLVVFLLIHCTGFFSLISAPSCQECDNCVLILA